MKLLLHAMIIFLSALHISTYLILTTIKGDTVILPMYKGGKRGPEKLGNFSKIT